VANVASRDLEFDYYIVGEGLTYPLAREIALKMKEISYVHAEGMMAGELKHGTLALITDGTPVLALPGDIDTTVSEVESRGGDVLQLSREGSEALLVFRAATFGFLMALEAARDRGLPVDRPRNLAKSVTVK
jgi:glucosamine--fructose-6-phosphate aminotransferase (isomerizing)